MEHSSTGKQHGVMERFAYLVTQAAGSTAAFLVANAFPIVWRVCRIRYVLFIRLALAYQYQHVHHHFLKVFLIQKAQNKDSLAIQLKLNELLSAHEKASNKMVNVENMSSN